MDSEKKNFLHFLYKTRVGHVLLNISLKLGFPKLAAKFLCSPHSKPFIGWYVRKHQIPLETHWSTFPTFADFFIRKRNDVAIDLEPSHLISPCDGYLSAYPIQPNSSFLVKGSLYRLSDLLQDEALGQQFYDGQCLIFRLCAEDYHHYCYIDDGKQGYQRFIDGTLHSVQDVACSTYPVYTLNRRCCTLLHTQHFGPVVQVEVGALAVGRIVNDCKDIHFCKGAAKGHFELAGSTILLLFQKDAIQLLPQITEALRNKPEVRVTQGMWIGTQGNANA